jgi:hypothetical protein
MESAAVATVADASLFIEGHWRAASGESFTVYNPTVGEPLDEALDIANQSRYRLSAYVFSQNFPAIMRTVQELQFGEIYINRTLGESVHAHHAGFKQSGTGREDGKWGVLRYTQIKTVYDHFGVAEDAYT